MNILSSEKEARELYLEALSSPLSRDEFKRRLVYFIEYDLFFIPAYLEHLWFAESENDSWLVERVLAETKYITWQIFFDKRTRVRIEDSWTTLEYNALKELLYLRIKYTSSYTEFFQIKTLLFLHKHLFKRRHEKSSAPTGTHLRLTKTYNTTEFSDDIYKLSSTWWNVTTHRARSIIHHQYTYTIPLRVLPKDKHHTTDIYIPVDDVHESFPTEHVGRFSAIHDLILNFAKENQYSLGGVSLICLQPHEQIYRHYDNEIFLQGRDRFHLILSCGENNILSSGDESVIASPGELWFFDNKVMHRACNGSHLPRIHAVFDCYPLGNDTV